MNSSPTDPALAAQELSSSELARHKMSVDALRNRLGDSASKQEKLREACEGFEAIFLQKLWEQMRKTVPKEGYLHSKDEETYQSLFDIELCKKMAGAGGIGLADMLYEQLAQQLEYTGRTTVPGPRGLAAAVPPSEHLSPYRPVEEVAAAPAKQTPPDDKKLTAENLYTPLPEANNKNELDEAEEADSPNPSGMQVVEGALNDLKQEIGLTPPPDKPGAAAAEWAARRAAMSGMPSLTPLEGGWDQSAEPQEEAASPLQSAGVAQEADKTPGETPRQEASVAGAQPFSREDMERADAGAAAKQLTSAEIANPALLSWQGNGPVSIHPKPSGASGRNRARGKKGRAVEENANTAPAPARSMAPQETLWPLEGRVVSRFGWEDDSSGKRRWNSGVRIAAPAQSPVRAALAGTVVYAGQREGYGYTVVLEHKNGLRTYYSNLQENGLKVGDKVAYGADFARLSAQATPSSHAENSAALHFEIKRGEMALNPESAIRRMTTASR